MNSIIEYIKRVKSSPKQVNQGSTSVSNVIIRFAGDSGDGVQLTGNQFTNTSAILGNSLAILPDFPAEIRAPTGTIAGVSGFQIHFSNDIVHTPGDKPDILVAMNPAALKANITELKENGALIVNKDSFTEKNLKKINYLTNPLEDDTLNSYHIISVPITTLTRESLKDHKISDKSKERCKNMFALGITYWLFERNPESTITWIKQKFENQLEIQNANITSLKAGINFAETSELLPISFQISEAEKPPGTYRNISGNEALSLGLVTASVLAKTPLLLATYPITPASDILHYLAKHKNFQIKTIQAEDEISACCMALGSGYSGHIGITSTSGPGLSLKSEAMSLAVMAEIPLVILNIQRAGPSTGMPTKIEQADLLQSFFGRHGESPLVIIAAKDSQDCFSKGIDAVRYAVKYRVPVILLSDGYIANGAAPWKIPDVDTLEPIDFNFHTDPETFFPYKRDEKTLARMFPKLGTPKLEHRIGGLEKQDVTGNISYDPENHERMSNLRLQKIKKIQQELPPLTVEKSHSQKSKTLFIGWGSTYGSIKEACKELAKENIYVDQLHLEFLNPFSKELEDILNTYKDIYVIEINLGQLLFILKGTFDFSKQSIKPINKLQGRPFTCLEIIEKFKSSY